MKALFSHQYRRLPWKNGLGVTEEISIEPHASDFTKNDFLWRISTARVDRSSEFSLFPNYDRILILFDCDGTSLKISSGAGNQVELKGYEPFRFSGDSIVHAELIGKPLSDLNIFVRRGKVSADVKTFDLETEINWQPNGDWNFCFVAQGSCQGTAGVHNARDTIETKTPLLLKGAAKLILISLRRT